jgi:hypothetical protein
MADRDFMGVPESALLAVGKVTVAAGLLEEVAQDIDHALGGTPGDKQFKNVIREIREHLANDLPTHARAEVSDIHRWTERAISAMDNRNRWAHSAYKKIYRAGSELEAQDVREAIRYAAEAVRERELPVNRGAVPQGGGCRR